MRTNFLLLMPLCIGLILSPGTGTAFAQAEDPVVDVAAARGYPPQQSIQVRELGEFLGRYVTVRVSERLDRPTRVRLQVEAISRDGERVSGCGEDGERLHHFERRRLDRAEDQGRRRILR